MNYFDIRKKGMLLGANPWYLLDTISAADVIAAYQFKGAGTEADALRDQSGNNLTLTKEANGQSITWSAGSGFTLGGGYQRTAYLQNTTINNDRNIVSAIVRFSGVSTNERAYLLSAVGSGGNAILFAATSIAEYTVTEEFIRKARYTNFGKPGSGYGAYGVHIGGTYSDSGMIGANFGSEGTLYVNGRKISAPNNKESRERHKDWPDRRHTFGAGCEIYNDLVNGNFATVTIAAAVLYSRALTDTEHQNVVAAMNNL